jgi:hypothetical protein
LALDGEPLADARGDAVEALTAAIVEQVISECGFGPRG